ncbi:MAG: hypothetical protein ACK5P6_01730, partial [Pseudobdellovibrionaceae bacterium]
MSEQDILAKKTMVSNLNEGTKYQFELSCRNLAIPFVEAVDVTTPFDLVVERQVTEEELTKRGLLNLTNGEVSLERLLIKKNGVIEFSGESRKLRFSSAVFNEGSRVVNYKEDWMTFDFAKSMGMGGKSGASLEIMGETARGVLSLDLRGYPGQRGEAGRDRAADELPTTPKNGDSASFTFEGSPSETFEECAQR